MGKTKNGASATKPQSAAKQNTGVKHAKNGTGASSNLTGKESSIVIAVGKLAAAKIDTPKRDMVQAMSGNGKTPEAFKKAMGSAKKKGYLCYPDSNSVALTPLGKEFVGEPDPESITNEVYHEEVIKPLLNKKQVAIFEAISDGGVYDKKEIAQQLGYDMNKLSGYDKDLSKMSTLGFLDKTKTTMTLTDKCFPVERHD